MLGFRALQGMRRRASRCSCRRESRTGRHDHRLPVSHDTQLDHAYTGSWQCAGRFSREGVAWPVGEFVTGSRDEQPPPGRSKQRQRRSASLPALDDLAEGALDAA